MAKSHEKIKIPLKLLSLLSSLLTKGTNLKTYTMKKLSETQKDVLFFVLGTICAFAPIWISFLLDIIN